ncbi:MAG: mannose-1-phosphate guanylyltransferase [Planctomycetota bacterium]|nr:mannose-1-phosphate guanylyltransferase [Planctomycetota bacterium]
MSREEDMEIYAVIMAGGSGTRFWPASRANRPKQFLPIAGEQPLITQTWARLEGLVPADRILVVTAEGMQDLVRECLPDLVEENLVVEPVARNTAACVALAAFEIERRNPEAVQLVLAADHVIEPAESFRRTLLAAAQQATLGGYLVTLGIRPDSAATGYGYIRSGEEINKIDGIPVLEVERFVEKPDRATAESFVKSGRFYWNSGIFVWRTASILEAFRAYQPEIHSGLAGANDVETLARVYSKLPAVQIDRAIMERTDNALMLPIDYHWSDVGSWAALTSVIEPDSDGNFAALAEGARLVAEGAKGCITYAEGDQIIALVGVQDLIVVHAGNATLICPRDRAQEVKLLVERLRRESPEFL